MPPPPSAAIPLCICMVAGSTSGKRGCCLGATSGTIGGDVPPVSSGGSEEAAKSCTSGDGVLSGATAGAEGAAVVLSSPRGRAKCWRMSRISRCSWRFSRCTSSNLVAWRRHSGTNSFRVSTSIIAVLSNFSTLRAVISTEAPNVETLIDVDCAIVSLEREIAITESMSAFTDDISFLRSSVSCQTA